MKAHIRASVRVGCKPAKPVRWGRCLAFADLEVADGLCLCNRRDDSRGSRRKIGVTPKRDCLQRGDRLSWLVQPPGTFDGGQCIRSSRRLKSFHHSRVTKATHEGAQL